MEGTSSAVAQWIAFQFSERIVCQYLSRASLAEVRQSADLARKMISGGRIPKLDAAIRRLQEQHVLLEPPEYTSEVGKDFDSSAHLAVSYVLSIYLRGPSYGWGLNGEPERPLYHHLWLRTAALRDTALVNGLRTEPPPEWFPWGSVLRRVFDPSAPLMPRNPGSVSEVLTALREQTPQVQRDLKLAMSGGLFRPFRTRAKDSRTEAEDTVIKALLAAGVHIGNPGHLEEALLRVVRKTAALLGVSAKLAAEEITAWIPNSWFHRKVDNVEANLRLTFRRDKFWDVFPDPGIRQAISTFEGHPDGP